MRFYCFFLLVLVGAAQSYAQAPEPGTAVLNDRDQLIRARYEEVLARTPLQKAAFDRVYESYMLAEGVDAWLAKLTPPEGQAETAVGLVLRGQILARQFRAPEAIEALGKAREMGEAGPEFNLLLGRLYYETGQDSDAITLLGAALEATADPEQRSAICRMLGNVYLRSGKRAEAAAAWERIAEANPGDLFALQEMAEIYEENRLWDEAIAARKRIVEAAANDPYRQCHAWRAIGQALAAKEDFAGAIAAYEQGLALAAPGNWLFEDLKSRLVGVYESMGDLEGLAAYLDARITQDPTDLSFRELLADVWMRRGETEKAEAVLKDILARAPGHPSASEMLITLYRQAGRMDDLAVQFEALIAQYPAEPDYLRRLGEAWLDHKQPEKAKEAWKRVLGDGTDADRHALLAGWLERSEFYPEAAAAYEAALALRPDREWQLRLAGLKYDMGDEAAALAAWQAAVAPAETPDGEVAEIASILLAREFKDEARALYARAMQLAPDNLDYVLAYARLLVLQGDHAGAAEHFVRLAEQNESEYFKGLGERGLLEAYAALGTLDQQRATWEAEIQANPGETVARLKLARLLSRTGNRPGVVKLYEECVALEPERVDLQRLLAEAYRENRQSEKAIAAYQALMEKDTGRAPAYLRELLALHGAMGMKDEAIRAAEKLVELSPASPEARTTLAQVYLRHGEQDKALQQFRDVLQIDTDDPARYREFGDALVQSNRLGEAQEIYRKMLDAARDDPTRLDAVTRLATVYVRSGQRDAVLAEFQRRLTSAPKRLAAYQELAAVQRVAGDPRGALETLERARGEVEETDTVLRLVMAEAYQAGDHQKVLSTFEELLARAAKPTPQELDRLAGAYALAGRLDEALAVWERIGQENKDDAAIQLMVARAMEANELYEESRAFVERALEIDPYDYEQRFEYARRLLMYNEIDKALEQLKLILEIGERPESAQGAPAGGAQAAPAQPAVVQSGASRFTPLGAFGGTRHTGQTFEDFRLQVVQMLVQTARQTDGMEAMLEAYRKRVEDQPESIDAQRDYLLVCEAAGEKERALATALALRPLQPEDLALRWRIFGYLEEDGRIDEAIQVATEMAAEKAEGPALQAKLALVRLYAENDRPADAEAMIKELAGEESGQAGMYFQIAGAIERSASLDVVEGLYRKSAELEPRYLVQSLISRARLHDDQGDVETARALLLEAVFAAPTEPDPRQQARLAATAAQGMAPLYLPQMARRGRQAISNVAQLPGFVYQATDHQRTQALNEIWQMMLEPEAFAPVIARLREEAARYLTAESDAERQHAGYFVVFLAAALRNTGQPEVALAEIQALAAGRPGDLFLQNLVLYLLDDQGRYDEMESVYAGLEAATPALRPDVARARLQIALAKDDVQAIPALYRALPPAPANTPARPFSTASRGSNLSLVVHTLQNAGALAEARALLEEELAHTRDVRTLTLASRAYALEQNHEKAIELAREAWQAQSGGSGVRMRGRGGLQYSQQGMTMQMQGLQGLEMLWNAYREAGREQELIDEFKERLEGQPASLVLRQSLVGLYMESRQYDLAREQMEKLLELRPNDIQLKVRYAGLLESSNDPEAALVVLESVVAARPSAARGIAREIQRLYRDLGKSEELAALQDRMMREARSASELQELAQELGRTKEFENAATLLERAFRMEPDNTWILLQLGDFLWQAEKRSEAIDAYLNYFKPESPGAGLHIDVGRMPELIQRFETAGRLDELKAVTAGTHPDEYTTRSLRLASALIARHEKRFEDAENALKEIAADGSDQQATGLLADMAEARGDLAGAMHYLENALKPIGNADYRRLAGLSLKLGNPEKAILYWKKFADQHGGYIGHEEAIRTLAGAGATDTARTYFLDVYRTIPAADPARRQLAESLIRANRETGRYDALIDTEIFGEATRYTGELAREYAGDFQELPGLARRRIAPLVERFPDDLDLLRVYALILEQTGDLDGALTLYERLTQDENTQTQDWDTCARLLQRAGQPEKRRDLVLSRLKTMKNPDENAIRTACEVLRESGAWSELPALKSSVLANTEPGQHLRLQFVFANIAADYGDVAGARAEMKALLDASSDNAAAEYYRRFLLRAGYLEEAAGLCKGALHNGSPSLAGSDFNESIDALLAAGDQETAVELLLFAIRQGDERAGSGSVGRVLTTFQEYNVAAPTLDGPLEPLWQRDTRSMKERLFLAEYAIALGRWDAALDLLEGHQDNNQVASLNQMALQNIPAERREAMFQGRGSAAPSPEPGATTTVFAGQDISRMNAADAAAVEIRTALGLTADGRREEAVAALDAITVASGNEHLLPQRARAYGEAGNAGKALADLNAYLAVRPDDDSARVQLAQFQVEAGAFAEAMAAWNATGVAQRSGHAVRFAETLVSHERYEDARAVLDNLGPAGAGRVEAVMLLARILHETGQDAEMVAMMELRYADLGEGSRATFSDAYAGYLEDTGLWKQRLGEAVDGQHPALLRAMLRLSQRGGGEDRQASMVALADGLATASFADPGDALAYGRLLASLDRRDGAVRVLAGATDLVPADGAANRDLVDALVNLGAHAEAARALLHLAQGYPVLLSTPAYVLDIAGRAGDSALADALLNRLLEAAGSDSQKAFLAALRTANGPDKADGVAQLAALIAAPQTTHDQLVTVAGILAEQNEHDQALTALGRIASGEFGSQRAESALLRIIAHHTQAGALDPALRAFAQLLPARAGIVQTARESVLACAEAQPYDNADRVILELVQAAPAAPGVSDLLALRSAIAGAQGLNAPALDLATLGVAETETREARLWANLIRAWRVGEPVRVRTWTDMAAPLDDALAAVMRGEAPVPTGWVLSNPRKVYPNLSMQDIDRPREWPGGSDYASYCLTEVESPDARTIVLAHGSWDWTRIWVNNTELLANPYSRTNLAATDRFESTLQPGINRILVRTRMANRDGEFSLAIVENGDGLILRAPSPATPAAAGE